MIVVKVGGSLYDHPRLGPGLQAYLVSLPEPALLVPGGGDFADAIRKLDAKHQLGEEHSHRLALQAMNLAGEFLKRLGVRCTMLDAVAFDAELPHSWDVTSDSIAAWAAVVFSASRLILLKSVDIPPGTSWYDAAERGWVDRHFPIIAYRLAASRLTGMVPVEVVNFRRWLDDSFPPHD